MDVKKTAEILGMHPESIRRSIREGHIPAKKVGREWIVDDEWINHEIDRRNRVTKRREESAYNVIRELMIDKNMLLGNLFITMQTTIKSWKELEEKHGSYTDEFLDELEYVLEHNAILYPENTDDEKLLQMWEEINNNGIKPIIRKLDDIDVSIREVKKFIKYYERDKTKDRGVFNEES